MRIILKIYVVLLTFILIFPIKLFAIEKTKIYVEDAIKYENSDKVTTKIYVKNLNSNIVALGINLYYDSSKLEVQSSKAGKDLESILKHGEDFPSEGRFSIAMISLSGFEQDGHYYSVTFNVKDDSDDIPIRLELKEASDKDGNDVPVELENGKITISRDNKNNNDTNTNTQEQKINDFSINNVKELTSIENILIENSNIKIDEEDTLSYEIENPNVIKVLEDGSLIVNDDGTSKVKVKVNGNDIGTIEVEVKDGNIKNLSGNDKINKEEYQEAINSNPVSLELASSDQEKIEIKNNYNSSQINESSDENKNLENKDNNLNIIIIGIVFLVLLLLILLIYKKNQRRKKW